MVDQELLKSIRLMMQEELQPVKNDIEHLKLNQSKTQAQIQGVKAEMHERFDKLESITEYALKQIDFLEQAYKA